MKDMIVAMIRDRVRDDAYFGENYRVTDLDTPARKGRLGKVIKCTSILDDEERARKLVELNLENDYEDDSQRTASLSDTYSLCNFIDCCHEAVLQAEVFDHPNIVDCIDYWITRPHSDGEEHVSENLLAIIDFLQIEGPEAELTDSVREAIQAMDGTYGSELVIVTCPVSNH